MKAIRTKVSDDGKLVRATDGDGNVMVIPMPKRSIDAHPAGAEALIRKMGWQPTVIVTGWLRAGEWVHVMLPPVDAQARRELERLSNGACNPVELACEADATDGKCIR